VLSLFGSFLTTIYQKKKKSFLTTKQGKMAMNKLTRKWRTSRDDKFSLPTIDDSRPIDTQGLSLSLSVWLLRKTKLEK
jgi:hypothetical protein